ncbi:MAG: hypothetical protein ACREI3_10110, partial [Nitrospirales bacterium]
MTDKTQEPEDLSKPTDSASQEESEWADLAQGRAQTEQVMDQVSDTLTAASDIEGAEASAEGKAAEEAVLLEEEKVKDEIDIQIDLLKDPDWAVRREAIVT